MRVLVSAASRHGSTAEMAAEIAAALSDAGLDAQVVAPDDVTSLDGFDAAVIGSAIYMNNWMAPARDLVDRLGDDLATMPVWLFSSGPIGDPPPPSEEPEEMAEILAATHARDHRIFAGRIDRAQLGLGEKVLTSALRTPEGDFRPWTDVRTWAEGIAGELTRGAGDAEGPAGESAT